MKENNVVSLIVKIMLLGVAAYVSIWVLGILGGVVGLILAGAGWAVVALVVGVVIIGCVIWTIYSVLKKIFGF